MFAGPVDMTTPQPHFSPKGSHPDSAHSSSQVCTLCARATFSTRATGGVGKGSGRGLPCMSLITREVGISS